MNYVRLGRSGMRVSRLCLGMLSFGGRSVRAWKLDEEAAEPIVRRAVEVGINFFDTADMYSEGESEKITGRLLRKFFTRRDEYVLATKVFFSVGEDGGPNGQGLSRKHIFASIDASLTRLGVDHVDLYQIHRWDPETPIEETMEALGDVVRAGKALYIGASSMFAWQFAKAQETARRLGRPRFVSMQNHYNLLYREEEREMIPLCANEGVGLIPWSPLARGLLAGSRGRGDQRLTVRASSDPLIDEFYQDADVEVLDAVRGIAEARGVSPAQIALAWLLRRGVAAPILGATKLHHVDDAVAATHTELSDAEALALESPYRSHSIRGHQ